MIDIRQHIKVRAMQRNQNVNIGVMRHDFQGTLGGIKAGDAVLYKDAQYEGDTCVIELPMNDDMIAEQRKRGSLITTWCTCVGIKKKFIEQILI